MGVAGALTRTPYSIGYLEFIYALRNELSYGAVKNAAGKFVRPDIDSISAGTSMRIFAYSGPGRDAYPIASFTWLLVSSKMPAGPSASAWRRSWTGRFLGTAGGGCARAMWRCQRNSRGKSGLRWRGSAHSSNPVT